MNVANWTYVTEICGMKQSDLKSLSLFPPNVSTWALFPQVSVQLLQQPLPAGRAELLHGPGQRL